MTHLFHFRDKCEAKQGMLSVKCAVLTVQHVICLSISTVLQYYSWLYQSVHEIMHASSRATKKKIAGYINNIF